MRSLGRFASSIVLGVVSAPIAAWAQVAPVTPPAPSGAAGSGAGTVTMLTVLGGLIVIVAIGVKLYDLNRKREADAVHLQAQLSDALLREPSLFGTPITPTVRVPMWSGTPATIEVTGEVPSDEIREAALRVIRAEASRVRSDFAVDDRTHVIERAATRAA
jgi:hypothetical protein